MVINNKDIKVMAKVLKKGVKPTSKKAVAKKATATKGISKNIKNAVMASNAVKGIKDVKTKKKVSRGLTYSPPEFTEKRKAKSIVSDSERKAKLAKKSENGKYYVEWIGKDGKKHREYRANRMDYKFGI